MLSAQQVTCLRDTASCPIVCGVPPATPTIGQNIKAARQRAKIAKQTEFGMLLRVPQSRASDLENDRYKALELSTLLHIAATINEVALARGGESCSLDDLLRGQNLSYDRTRDLVRHSETAYSSAVPSGAQQGETNGAAATELASRHRELADELRSIAGTFTRALQGVADRLAGDMAPSPITRTARTHRHKATSRVRSTRKVG